MGIDGTSVPQKWTQRMLAFKNLKESGNTTSRIISSLSFWHLSLISRNNAMWAQEQDTSVDNQLTYYGHKTTYYGDQLKKIKLNTYCKCLQDPYVLQLCWYQVMHLPMAKPNVTKACAIFR